MSLVINTNVSSLVAQRNLTNNTTALNRSLERLSSGYRINRGADDAAGLQISEKLRSQVRGSEKALDNTQDGVAVLNIVDGAYGRITENLQRMRELVVQAANDTNGSDQRNAIESELDELGNEITRIGDSTQFNGRNLLNGSITSFKLQVGPNDTSAQNTIDVSSAFNNVDSTSLGLDDANVLVDSNANSLNTLSRLDVALQTVNNKRSTIGAYVNRLESTASFLMVSIENQKAAESRIRNVDVAAESARLVSNQILQQAAAAMLGQANQAPSLALQLLG